MIDCWTPTEFYRAIPGKAPVVQWGYGYRGMVLHNTGWGKPRSKTQWSLIHRGSGGVVLWFTGSVATVFPVAGEIADAGDWTAFDLPEGWRQVDPDLPAKVAAIAEMHPEATPVFGHAKTGAIEITREDALAVIDARDGVGQ